tara:strand:+ start:1104 stop:1757 length:654 start_codon:yes stop_codon:yes gene_type:complete
MTPHDDDVAAGGAGCAQSTTPPASALKVKIWVEPLFRIEDQNEKSDTRQWLWFCPTAECTEGYARAKKVPQLLQYIPKFELRLIDLGDASTRKVVQEVLLNELQSTEGEWNDFMPEGKRTSNDVESDDLIASKLYARFNEDYDGWHTPQNERFMHEEVVVFDWVTKIKSGENMKRVRQEPPRLNKRKKKERRPMGEGGLLKQRLFGKDAFPEMSGLT